MTPAELKTIREACGLSLQQLASAASVQERTARYWESGHSPVPHDVARFVLTQDQQLDQASSQAVDQVLSVAQAQGQPADLVLLRYRTDDDLHAHRADMQNVPASTHAALLYRVRKKLAPHGIIARIVFLDPSDYNAWRGKRTNTETLRAQWAALQLPITPESDNT